MRNLFLILLSIYGPAVSASNIYTCTIGDNTIFSQSPCGETDIQIEVKATQSYQSKNQRSTNNSSLSSKSTNNTNSFINKKKTDRVIKKIENLSAKMSKELNILENKSMHASNNRAGAIYKQAISNEMIAATNKYKNLIDIQKIKLKVLQNNSN